MTVVLNISWLENIFSETAISTNLNRRPRIEAEARGLLMPACVNDKSGLGRRYLSIWNKKGVNIFSIYQLSHGQFCGLLLFCSMQGVIGNSRHAVSRKKLGWKVPAVSFQGFPVVWPVTSFPASCFLFCLGGLLLEQWERCNYSSTEAPLAGACLAMELSHHNPSAPSHNYCFFFKNFELCSKFLRREVSCTGKALI